MPPEAAVARRRESSGDFGFSDDGEGEERDGDYYYDDSYDDYEAYEDEASGSGHGAAERERPSPGRNWPPPTQRPDADNGIPERAAGGDPGPDHTEPRDNRIPPLRSGPGSGSRLPSDVLMSHAAPGEGASARTEVLAALICGGGVGLLLALLLVALLLHRMKKKDEGSYELAKKPIYTKAPTAEIYA